MRKCSCPHTHRFLTLSDPASGRTFYTDLRTGKSYWELPAEITSGHETPDQPLPSPDDNLKRPSAGPTDETTDRGFLSDLAKNALQSKANNNNNNTNGIAGQTPVPLSPAEAISSLFGGNPHTQNTQNKPSGLAGKIASALSGESKTPEPETASLGDLFNALVGNKPQEPPKPQGLAGVLSSALNTGNNHSSTSNSQGSGVVGAISSVLNPKPPETQSTGISGILGTLVGKPQEPPKPQGFAGALSSALTGSNNSSNHPANSHGSGLGGILVSALTGNQQSSPQQNSGLGGALSTILGNHSPQKESKASKVTNLLVSALNSHSKDVPAAAAGATAGAAVAGASPSMGNVTHVPASGSHGMQDFSANVTSGEYQWQKQAHYQQQPSQKFVSGGGVGLPGAFPADRDVRAHSEERHEHSGAVHQGHVSSHGPGQPLPPQIQTPGQPLPPHFHPEPNQRPAPNGAYGQVPSAPQSQDSSGPSGRYGLPLGQYSQPPPQLQYGQLPPNPQQFQQYPPNQGPQPPPLQPPPQLGYGPTPAQYGNQQPYPQQQYGRNIPAPQAQPPQLFGPGAPPHVP